MITINNLKQLETYKTKTELINKNGIRNLITYTFKENNKPAEVVLNIELDFGNKLNIPKDIKDLFDIPNLKKDDKCDCVEFVAKNIHAKEPLKIGMLSAEEFFFEKDCTIINCLNVNKLIQGATLNCDYLTVTCEKIVCNMLTVEKVICKHLEAKQLCMNSFYFENLKAKNVNGYDFL